jgi:hypothetical protein
MKSGMNARLPVNEISHVKDLDKLYLESRAAHYFVLFNVFLAVNAPKDT